MPVGEIFAKVVDETKRLPQWFRPQKLLHLFHTGMIAQGARRRRDEFIIAFFGPGEMFGEVAVFENRPYPASAQTVTDTEVLGIKRADFSAFLASRPQVALRIINILGGRLRDAQSRLRDLAGERVEQRVASVLEMLSSKLGPTLPFTRQEIADMTGTTTETAIRVMSLLKSRGIISSVRGKVTITDEQKLRLLSEGYPQV